MLTLYYLDHFSYAHLGPPQLTSYSQSLCQLNSPSSRFSSASVSISTSSSLVEMAAWMRSSCHLVKILEAGPTPDSSRDTKSSLRFQRRDSSRSRDRERT